jgi:hypothetical protein
VGAIRFNMRSTFSRRVPMFLSAVLQAHTDSLPQTDRPEPTSQADDTVELPARLKEALTVPAQERRQPLPSVHRSRWI